MTFSFLLGHLTGKHERHFAVSGCPLYHNLSADECKVSITKHTCTRKSHSNVFLIDNGKITDNQAFVGGDWEQ